MDDRNHATRRRQEKQESLRDFLSSKCTVQHLVNNIEKIENEGETLSPQGLQAIKIANEQRIRLLNKYLPDLKAVEISGDQDSPLTITKIERVIVRD